MGTGGTGHCTEIALHGTVEQERLRAALYISLIRGLRGETYHIIESLLIDQRERDSLLSGAEISLLTLCCDRGPAAGKEL